ncbi:hypothetical protein MCOR34_003147 [Pyricularia oryzae]|nr:hypothetical protein MCOR34_003147 [Pyricularia oryzae]KAI6460807.1 hypothetical protein MCOR17_006577 [Pyricularia oryzae]
MSSQNRISAPRCGIRDIPVPQRAESSGIIRNETELRWSIYNSDADSSRLTAQGISLYQVLHRSFRTDPKLTQEVPERDRTVFALPFLALNSNHPIHDLGSLFTAGYQNINRRSPDNIPFLAYVAAKTAHLTDERREDLFEWTLDTCADPQCIPMELWRRPGLPMPLQLSQDLGPMADWCTPERLDLLKPHLTVFMRDSLCRCYEALGDFCDIEAAEIALKHMPALNKTLRLLPRMIRGQNYALHRLVCSLRSYFSEGGPKRSIPYCAMLTGQSAPVTSRTARVMKLGQVFGGYSSFEITLERSDLSIFGPGGMGSGRKFSIWSGLDHFLTTHNTNKSIVIFHGLLGCDKLTDDIYDEIGEIISSVKYQDRTLSRPSRRAVDISKTIFIFTSPFAEDLIAEHKEKWYYLREIEGWQKKSPPDAADRFMSLVEFSKTPAGSACMEELIQAIRDKARSMPDSSAWQLASQVCDGGSVIPHFPMDWEDMNILAQRKTQEDGWQTCFN